MHPLQHSEEKKKKATVFLPIKNVPVVTTKVHKRTVNVLGITFTLVLASKRGWTRAWSLKEERRRLTGPSDCPHRVPARFSSSCEVNVGFRPGWSAAPRGDASDEIHAGMLGEGRGGGGG